MTKRDVFEIISKAFGIYCIVQFIRSTPAVIGAIVVNQPDFITNRPLYISLMSLYPLIFLFLSVIFIRKSDRLTNFFFPKSNVDNPSEDQRGDQNASYAQLSFWIVIIGFYYLISSTASVLTGLPAIYAKVKNGWFLTHDPFLPQALIFIMSIVCILKSEKIEELIIKLKIKKT
jgi:hypothetical protein